MDSENADAATRPEKNYKAGDATRANSKDKVGSSRI
jgi:hypothetical protein